ncbi:MAG: protoglobin domain-containing protein [Neomegalonema sp.]|nr:protoglobin domain-containing protein [Neomegalonema sp.]
MLTAQQLNSDFESKTEGEIKKLLSWSAIEDADVERIASIASVSEDFSDAVIQKFYDHILSFEEAADMFASESTLERVKRGQKEYFRQLTAGVYDQKYFAERKRIGQIHETAGIGPALYIGAYAFYLNQVGLELLERVGSPEEAFRLHLSLLKLAHLDMALALQTYVEARETTIEAQQREMSELPTPVLQVKAGLLLVPVVGTLDSHRARSLTIALLESIQSMRARVLVLDITGVSAVDSMVANHLLQTMTAARLMGAHSIITGISPTVAEALVKIGVDATSLNTFGDLERGFEEAERIMSAHREE